MEMILVFAIISPLSKVNDITYNMIANIVVQ